MLYYIIEYSSLGRILIRGYSPRVIEVSSLEIFPQELLKLSMISNLWEMMYEIGCYIVRDQGGD